MNRYGQLDDPLVNWVANSVIATDEFVDGQDYKKRKDDILENPLERIDLDDKYTWKIAREITNSEDITSISIAIENLYKFTENRPTNQTIGDLIEQCESKTCEEGIYKSVHLLSSFVFIANKYGLSTNKLLGDICIDRKRRNEILTEYTRFYEQASKLGYKIKKPVLTLDAYGTALSIKLLHMPFFPACLMGILAAMLAGGLIGRATLRLKGDYFVIATLAIGECTKLLIENIPSITGGSRGLTDIPKKTSLLLVWVILLAVIVILSNFLHSKHGRNCIAVREEELAAKSIGIDVIRYKMLAFLISCALCGLAGGLLAGYMGYLYPTMFTMAKSNELTMTVILGGTGSLTGTILAGLVLIPLPEYLRIESAEEWRMVLYGVLVVAVIVFKPSGLMGSKEFTVAGVLRRCKQLAARVRKRGSKRDKEGEAKK